MEWVKYVRRVCDMKYAYKIPVVTINASGLILHISLASSVVPLKLGVCSLNSGSGPHQTVGKNCESN
jgi:hypothetical protein